MKIQCRKCGNIMEWSELLTYAQVYLLKTLEKVLVAFLIRTVEYYLLSRKKSIIANQMA